MTGLMINKILNYFDELIPNPKCELNYCSDFEFLIAVVLSAQTTDYKVNSVTKELFKYDINSLKIEEINNIIKPIGMSLKKSYYVKGIAKYVSKYGIPKSKDELLKLYERDLETGEQVIEKIEYDFDYNGVKAKVTSSIGLTMNYQEFNSPADILKSADEALYKAKESGRNRVVLHEQ